MTIRAYDVMTSFPDVIGDVICTHWIRFSWNVLANMPFSRVCSVFHQNAKFKPRRSPWMQKTPKFGWRHTLLVAKVSWSVAKQLWSVAMVLRLLLKYYDWLLRWYDRLLRCYGRLLRWYARLPKCYGCCSGDMVGC